MMQAAYSYDAGPSFPKYTGKERDTESGNDYFNARYYASSMGRFMSPDPLPWLGWQHPPEGSSEEEEEESHKKFEEFIANPQNFNMYAYVNNNPLNHTDPTGMAGCKAGDKTSPLARSQSPTIPKRRMERSRSPE